METNKKIGSGAQAEVFLSENCAVKLFKQGYDKSAVFYEAAVTALVEKTGLPIAKVQEVIQYNDRLALKMDYVSGKSLHENLLENETKFLYYLELMVEIQLNIFSKKLDLPFSLKERLETKITVNSDIEESTKKALFLRLSTLPEGDQLCHGDLHGYNILIQDDKPFIIDWVDAVKGYPDGDVCRTYMLYSFHHVDFAEAYMDCYCKKAKKNKSDVMQWLPVVAAARLIDNNAHEKEKIMYWIDNML
ncbi:aminoglycoside phosphotransferase family protein [Scatolibacter rhodanostii]|uniref:aminoglycoside phosphotransferase family protein n=1 Tax=Scatolibacter rhodanostii TaxID=2014781 RepID=UPI000C08736D|nr:aminoglycoside phosphotransferase family protein [Scatolibacter rhodanostii]